MSSLPLGEGGSTRGTKGYTFLTDFILSILCFGLFCYNKGASLFGDFGQIVNGEQGSFERGDGQHPLIVIYAEHILGLFLSLVGISFKFSSLKSWSFDLNYDIQ